jgi:hypothetical protein
LDVRAAGEQERPFHAAVLALHEHHVLAPRAVFPFARLRDHALIVGRDPRHAAWLERLRDTHGFEPRVGPRVAQIVSGIVVAAGGFGVAVEPASTQAWRPSGAGVPGAALAKRYPRHVRPAMRLPAEARFPAARRTARSRAGVPR